MAGDTFTTNPLVQAIGEHLGLASLMGADPSGEPSQASPQAAAAATPPPPKVTQKVGKSQVEGSAQPREFRQHAPMAKTPVAGGRGLQPGGAGMQMPGMMSPDILMHPEVQALLGRFGISPQQLQSTAQGASPNLFITNPDAQTNHPVATGMLDRALAGLAFTQGGRTVGESISNVARGMLDANAARSEKYNNQLMMPFQQAATVANLQGLNQKQQFEEAETRRANSQADLFDQTPQMRMDIANVAANQRQQATEGRLGMQRVANHLKLQMMPEFSQLSPEHSAALQQEIQKNGGDLGNLGDDRMEFYRQLGHEDGLAATTKSKQMIRATPTTSYGTGRSSLSPEDRQAFTIAGKEYSDAGHNLGAFDRETDSLSKSNVPQMLNGKLVIPSISPEWQADRASKRKVLDQAAQGAKLKYEGFGKKQGATSPASSSGHVPTYNPSTGKIE
jgi:hypothetical protein